MLFFRGLNTSVKQLLPFGFRCLHFAFAAKNGSESKGMGRFKQVFKSLKAFESFQLSAKSPLLGMPLKCFL